MPESRSAHFAEASGAARPAWQKPSLRTVTGTAPKQLSTEYPATSQVRPPWAPSSEADWRAGRAEQQQEINQRATEAVASSEHGKRVAYDRDLAQDARYEDVTPAGGVQRRWRAVGDTTPAAESTENTPNHLVHASRQTVGEFGYPTQPPHESVEAQIEARKPRWERPGLTPMSQGEVDDLRQAFAERSSAAQQPPPAGHVAQRNAGAPEDIPDAGGVSPRGAAYSPLPDVVQGKNGVDRPPTDFEHLLNLRNALRTGVASQLAAYKGTGTPDRRLSSKPRPKDSDGNSAGQGAVLSTEEKQTLRGVSKNAVEIAKKTVASINPSGEVSPGAAQNVAEVATAVANKRSRVDAREKGLKKFGVDPETTRKPGDIPFAQRRQAKVDEMVQALSQHRAIVGAGMVRLKAEKPMEKPATTVFSGQAFTLGGTTVPEVPNASGHPALAVLGRNSGQSEVLPHDMAGVAAAHQAHLRSLVEAAVPTDKRKYRSLVNTHGDGLAEHLAGVIAGQADFASVTASVRPKTGPSGTTAAVDAVSRRTFKGEVPGVATAAKEASLKASDKVPEEVGKGATTDALPEKQTEDFANTSNDYVVEAGAAAGPNADTPSRAPNNPAPAPKKRKKTPPRASVPETQRKPVSGRNKG